MLNFGWKMSDYKKAVKDSGKINKSILGVFLKVDTKKYE